MLFAQFKIKIRLKNESLKSYFLQKMFVSIEFMSCRTILICKFLLVRDCAEFCMKAAEIASCDLADHKV
jgi:hypothetical protein